jgi:hypothetical protein
MFYGSKKRKNGESERVVIFYFRFLIGCDAYWAKPHWLSRPLNDIFYLMAQRKARLFSNLWQLPKVFD